MSVETPESKNGIEKTSEQDAVNAIVNFLQMQTILELEDETNADLDEVFLHYFQLHQCGIQLFFLI